MEKVTLAGDWHGDAASAERVVHEAYDAGSEVVVHLGDFGVWPGRRGERFLDAVEAVLASTGLELRFIDGNHEDFVQLESLAVDEDGLRTVRPGLKHITRGARWEWNSLTWVGLGGATSLNRPDLVEGVSWWDQEEISLGDAMRTQGGGGADVMLTHDVPAGVTVPGMGSDATWRVEEVLRARRHRELLRGVVEVVRPTHLFHGHFHKRYESTLTLGGLEVSVTGLDRDGTGPDNWMHLDLDVLAAESLARR